MKVTVVLNHRSGLPKLLSIVRHKLETRITELGHEVTILDIDAFNPPNQLAAQAVQAGCELIVAAGGDGTVNGIAQAIAGTNVPVFHFPLGSGNGFARTMGIPLKLDASLELLANPIIRRVDTARVNGKLFVIACGFGLDALIAHDFKRVKLRGVGPYVWFGLWNYAKFKPERFRMKDLDTNETWESEVLVVVATNSSQYGGGAIIAPGALPDDGWLEWIEGKPVRWYESLRVGTRLFRGTLDKEAKLSRRKIKRIQVERLSDRREIHLDGEALFSERVNFIEIVPSSLSVVVGPAHKDGW